MATLCHTCAERAIKAHLAATLSPTLRVPPATWPLCSTKPAATCNTLTKIAPLMPLKHPAGLVRDQAVTDDDSCGLVHLDVLHCEAAAVGALNGARVCHLPACLGIEAGVAQHEAERPRLAL